MTPADRAKLGKAGMTAEEAEAAFVSKNEGDLQALIETMLNRHGVHVIVSRFGKKTTTRAGTPDMLFAVNGRAVAWEIKIKGNKPTSEQIATMEAMTANGWACAVIYSYDEALSAYRQLATPANPASR